MGRFISPDDISYLEPATINGLNLYSYVNNNPISGGSFAAGVISNIKNNTIKNIGYHSSYANSSNILSAFNAVSTSFLFVDQWSAYLTGGVEAGLNYWGAAGVGIQSLSKYSNALSAFGKGMVITGSILSWGSSVYNNFTNPNYTTNEAVSASFIDAAYYTGKGFGTYWAGVGVGKAAVGLGVAAGGAAIYYLGVGFAGAAAIGGGVAVVVGVVGAVAIYYLGEGIDWLYERFKEWIFE